MKFIALIALLNLEIAVAHSNFVKTCNSAASIENEINQDINSQILWLSTVLKSKKCSEIETKLKNLSSFASIFPVQISESKQFHNPPMEMLPLELQFPKFDKLSEIIKEIGINPASFKDLRLFKEFTNLRHYVVGPDENRNICDVINEIPSIRSITLFRTELSKNEINCLKNKSISLFIAGQFKGEKLESNMIDLITGIENYKGDLIELQHYKNLRYLGLKNYKKTSTLQDLTLIKKLSNLSLNIKDVDSVEEISNLTTLENLTLNCYDKEPGSYDIEVQGGDDCHYPRIIRIGFISKLKFLKALDLGWNQIQDFSPLKNMRMLKYLNLRNNKIKTLPDLSNMRALEEVILDNNLIEIISNNKVSKIKFKLDNNPIDRTSESSCPKDSSNTSIRNFCNSF